MKPFVLVAMMLLGVTSLLKSQDINHPAQIIQIMEKSDVTYVLNVLGERIEEVDRSDNLNLNTHYRTKEKEGWVLTAYKIGEKGEKYLQDAEQLFKMNKVAEAREMYLKVLEEEPSFYKIMTYIGQTYDLEGNKSEAIDWYKKAIKNNDIDYMAYWFLADAYMSTGKKKKAVPMITKAMILNRNNPRIAKSFETIYKANKLKVPNWTFTPQMRIDSTSSKEVVIHFDEDWLGYALVKALWKYEPNYRESKGVKEGELSTTEEIEALLGFSSVLGDKKKLKKQPAILALAKAMDKDLVLAYIYYEIYLPQYPHLVYNLTPEFIGSIEEYVINVRGTK